MLESKKGRVMRSKGTDEERVAITVAELGAMAAALGITLADLIIRYFGG